LTIISTGIGINVLSNELSSILHDMADEPDQVDVDDINRMATALKRQIEANPDIGGLLQSFLNENNTLEIAYQLVEDEPSLRNSLLVTLGLTQLHTLADLRDTILNKIHFTDADQKAYLARHHAEVLEAIRGALTQNAYPTEMKYLCGRRLAEVRTALWLPPSAFARYMGFMSEREVVNIEKGAAECPESRLRVIAEKTGYSLKWMCDGTGLPYPAKRVDAWLREPQSVIVDLYDNVSEVYFCLSDETFRLAIAAKFREYPHLWKVYSVTPALALWEGYSESELKAMVPRYFAFLACLYCRYRHVAQSKIIDEWSFEQLISGMYYPGLIAPQPREGSTWFMDLMHPEVPHPASESQRDKPRRQTWFIDIRGCFRKYLGPGYVNPRIASLPSYCSPE
jgi:DNA-binding transcriptional regulator YiaG